MRLTLKMRMMVLFDLSLKWDGFLNFFFADEDDKDGEKSDKAIDAVADEFTNAPASVPRDTLREFSSELKSIQKHLESERKKIKSVYEHLEKKVEELKKKKAAEEAKIAEIKKKAAEIRAKEIKDENSEYRQEIKKAEKQLEDAKKSVEWVKGLKERVAVLKEGAEVAAMPAASDKAAAAADKKYTETLADLKDELYDNADLAEEITGIDVTSDLQELEDTEVHSNFFHEDDIIAHILWQEMEEVEKKLYEAGKLRDLVAKLEKVAEPFFNEKFKWFQITESRRAQGEG